MKTIQEIQANDASFGLVRDAKGRIVSSNGRPKGIKNKTKEEREFLRDKIKFFIINNPKEITKWFRFISKENKQEVVNLINELHDNLLPELKNN
jgi:hypothetical protein